MIRPEREKSRSGLFNFEKASPRQNSNVVKILVRIC